MDRVFEAPEAKVYEQWLETRSGRAYARTSLALLDQILDCRRGWRILDVGCGLGVHLAHLRERGMLVTGLEAGPVMARMAGSRLGEQADVDVGDAHDLPYEDNSFDAVIMVNTLELMERRAQALSEAARVAASRVCLISLNPVSLPGLWLRRPGARHALYQGAQLSLLYLRRLVREVLGPVPRTWAGATLWPGTGVGRRPWAGLVGMCAAVTPRYLTRPLVADSSAARRPARPAHITGRVSNLWLVK